MGRAQCVKDFVGNAAPERVLGLGKKAMKKSEVTQKNARAQASLP